MKNLGIELNLIKFCQKSFECTFATGNFSDCKLQFQCSKMAR